MSGTITTDMPNSEDDLPSIDKLSKQSITSVLASSNPPIIRSPQDAADILFYKSIRHKRARINYEFLEREITDEDLDIAANYGQFPFRPSDLFLKLFHNVLCTLRRDPLSGVVSPCLIGTSGTIPLTIISTIPDIMQHYYHCIVHAKKEVLLATNFWEKSESVNIIGKALRDLSKRAGEENRYIIVKIMIDHPTKDNITHFHSILPINKYPDYDIPLPNEIPNISLQVNNYHRIIMGTFHSKFMIVDRRLALLNSNNIQDRPNLEMMSHFEGDIVNSFYDTFLISWWLPFEPNLVCLKDELNMKEHEFKFGIHNTKILSIKQPLQQAIARARLRLQSHLEEEETNVYRHAPLASEEDEKLFSALGDRDRFSNVAIQALVDHRRAHSPNVLVRATNDIAGAIVGYDLTPRSESPLTVHLNKSSKSAQQTQSCKHLTEQDLKELTLDFSPFIFHQKHQPFPLALVSRAPHGTPGHIDTANPQGAAWIGAFRYAKKSIFIQSPTLNATPAIDGIISACRRGVVVTLWLDLGFNDSVEGIGTFQGGTNEYIVKKIYKKLRDENDGAEQYLEVYWYTGKGLFDEESNFSSFFLSIEDLFRSNTSIKFLSKTTKLSY